MDFKAQWEREHEEFKNVLELSTRQQEALMWAEGCRYFCLKRQFGSIYYTDFMLEQAIMWHNKVFGNNIYLTNNYYTPTEVVSVLASPFEGSIESVALSVYELLYSQPISNEDKLVYLHYLEHRRVGSLLEALEYLLGTTLLKFDILRHDVLVKLLTSAEYADRLKELVI